VIAVDLRLAGHGLADPPTGYPQLDEFRLGSARLRWEPATGAVRLSELTAVGVRSLADFGRFDRRLSWQLSAGATTLRDGGCSGCLAGQGEAGLGLATSLGPGSFLTVFALADAAVQGTPRLSGIGGGPVRIGLGPAAGARALLPGRLVVLATGSWWWLPGASPGDVWTWTVEARLGLGKAALGASFRADPQERLGLATAYLYF